MNDEVLFTFQWAAVVDGLHRELGMLLKRSLGVTYLMFCLMASVRSHEGRMTLADFPRGTLANDNTVVVAANGAVHRGLLEKRRSPDDRRIMQLSETDAGAAAVDRGFRDVHAYLTNTVWRSHTDADIDQTMHAFPCVMRNLGIDAVEINHRCHQVITPSYLMCIAGFLRRWETRIACFAGLTFTEYRCLALLEHRLSALSCALIASELRLDRSSISPVVARLEKRGYVDVGRGTDRRTHAVSLTDKGSVVAVLATAQLERATAELFSDARPADKAKANELHMRMYASYIE